MSNFQMPKIAIIAHIYYPDVWVELMKLIKNLQPSEYDLYASVVEGVDTTSLHQYIHPKNLFVVKNRGFDIGGLFEVLNHIDISPYEYICKIHTKKSAYRKDTSGHKWRDQIVLPLLGQRRSIINIMRLFNTSNKPTTQPIGMIGANQHLKVLDNNLMGCNKEKVEWLCSKYNIDSNLISKSRFFAGTMFWAKREFFQKIKEMNFDSQSFEPVTTTLCDPEGKNHQMIDGVLYDRDAQVAIDGQLAHAFERVFGVVAYSMNYKLHGI